MSIQYVWGHNTKHFWEVSVQVLVVAFRPFAFCSYQDWPSLSFCCGNNNNIIPLSFVRFIVNIISTILMLRRTRFCSFPAFIHRNNVRDYSIMSILQFSPNQHLIIASSVDFHHLLPSSNNQ
jgi:hypothetical protein